MNLQCWGDVSTNRNVVSRKDVSVTCWTPSILRAFSLAGPKTYSMSLWMEKFGASYMYILCDLWSIYYIYIWLYIYLSYTHRGNIETLFHFIGRAMCVKVVFYDVCFGSWVKAKGIPSPWGRGACNWCADGGAPQGTRYVAGSTDTLLDWWLGTKDQRISQFWTYSEAPNIGVCREMFITNWYKLGYHPCF